MSNLSTYYSFNQPDINLNNQIQNWATGSPVYDASLNGGYISSQNYKTGNGSLEFPKNTFLPQGTITTVTENMQVDFVSITDDELTMIGCVTGGLTYYQTRTSKTNVFTNSWTTKTNESDTTSRNYFGIAVTADGSKFVTCVKNGYVYFATKSSDAGYNPLVQVDYIARNYQGIAMTKDGNTIVACAAYNGIYFANWNGSSYNAFTNTLEQNTDISYYGIGISSNGDRIVYANLNDNTRYLSFWNGSSYNKGTLIYSLPSSSGNNVRSCCFNNDSSILFLSYYNRTSTIEYGKYNNNSNSYDTFTSIDISLISNCLGISCIDSSGGKCTIYVNSNYGTPINNFDLSYNTTITNYCMIKPQTINNDGLTITCWFRSNYNLNNAPIFDFATANTSTSDNIRLLIINDYLQFVIYKNTNSTSYVMDISRNYINDNKWYHTAITMDSNSSEVTVYINGSTSTLTSNTFSNIPYPTIITRPYCYLGKSNTPNNPQFFGNIDDFRIYNSVLSQDNITNLYNNTNVKNNYINSTIYRLYDTAVNNASTPITPNTSLTNVGTSQTYYYWNDPYAKNNTINNSANPYNFYYTYINNNTPLLTSAKVSVIINDSVTLKLNGVIQTNILNRGNTFAVTVEPLISGNNLFEFLTYSNGGSAYFAAYVTDSNSNYLFSTTKSDMGRWNVNITGFFSNGYPLSSLLQKNYPSSTAITTSTNYRTNNYDLTSNYTKVFVIASTNTNTNISNASSDSYNDINNVLFSYIPSNVIISEPFASNLKLYYKFNLGDLSSNKFFNYATGIYDTSNYDTYKSLINSIYVTNNDGTKLPSIKETDYKIGTGSLILSGTNYFTRPAFTLTTSSTFTISLWFKLYTISTPSFILNFNTNNDRIVISLEKPSTAMYIALEIPPNYTQYIINDVQLEVNKWYYLGWSCTGTQFNVRFNESVPASVGTRMVNSFSRKTFNNCFIGAESFDANKFNGLIDDLRIYDIALSANELLTLNNIGLRLPVSEYASNLKLHYRFNVGDITNNQILNYVNRLFDTTNYGTIPSINENNYTMGNGSLNGNGTSYFTRPAFTLTTASTFTISLWFNLNYLITTDINPFILNFSNSNNTSRITVSFKLQNSNMYVALESPSDSTQYIIYDVPMVANKWYYLGWSCSGTQWNVRLNDSVPASVGTKLVTAFTETIFTSCTICAQNSTGVNKFNGLIDDLRMYNNALSASQLLTINSFGTPTTTTSVMEQYANNLKLHYKFDVGDSINLNSIYDLYSYITPVLNGTDYVIGKGSLRLPGNNYLKRYTTFTLTTDSTFTISLWFKPTSISTLIVYILNFYNGTDRISVSIKKPDIISYLALEIPPSKIFIIYDVPIETNKWYYLGWSCTGTQWNVRLNESVPASVGTNLVTTFSQKSFNNCFIGTENESANHNFIGFIDDLRIYDVALSESELRALNNYRN